MLLVALVAARLAAATWAGIERTGGDFYASMPGAYVETLNPDLWNSPDMGLAWGYHRPTYFHGPTQYLTLYPLALLDRFSQIAAVLLVLYAGVLAAIYWLLWRSVRRLGADRDFRVPLLASTFLFFPLLQAYVQREFEIVITAALCGALWWMLDDKKNRAAALLAYVAWFKYIPLLFAGYLVLRRWWRGLAVFVAVSAGILVASQVLFGLDRFFNNNVPGHAAQAAVLWGHGFAYDATGHLYGTGFCDGWHDNETTATSVKSALCTIASTQRWINPALIYLALCAAVAMVYLSAHARLERAGDSGLEWRRRALEMSIVITICACFFFSHYYYFALLIVPLNILLAFYWIDGRRGALAWWAAAYALLGAFVVPNSILNRLFGFNVWEPYMWRAIFFYGEMLLMILLLREYWGLAALRPVDTLGTPNGVAGRLS
jgi:hypothetical protein